ncbi:MAG: diguanylate cyclase [Deltaproteobacteria bacterium]|nr:diguanylate cyclase [Deltaproteobacteria bacterium]
MANSEFEGKTVIADMSKIRKQPRASEKGSPSLIQYTGNDVGKRFLLDKPQIKLGRSAESDITIAEGSVSRLHAKIFCEEDGVYLEDAGSANGTFLNDETLEKKKKLKDQDLIRLGTVLLKFFAQDNWDGLVQDHIYRKATIDAGTQIFNKQFLMDTLESEIRKAKLTGKKLAIIYFDLDHFKKVNDFYGHNAGDTVLANVAKLIQKVIRKEDVFARFGGEEFVVVLQNTDLEQAARVAETMRQKCEAAEHSLKYQVKGTEQTVEHKQTISLGVAVCDESMNSVKELLEAADQKLYTSKSTGRNRVTY